MATSSSAKKVAKLASRGKGKKVRFQGGTLFPAVVLVVVILGLLLVVYGRQTRPAAGEGQPAYGEHWHAAFGIYVCDTFQPKLQGNKEESGTDPITGENVLLNDLFATTGVHSHDDGVIHWHPYTSKATGNRAKLGLFLDVYGIELSTERLALPEDQGGDVWETDTFRCVDEDGDEQETEIKVVAWSSYADPDSFQVYVTDLKDVRLRNDGMVFVIAVVEKGKSVPLPPWAAELPALGAADGGNVPVPTSTGDTVPASTPASPSPASDTTTETDAATSTTEG